ncbi:hypothetical protein [Streptomyces nigrescens]|uniref:hypothetical protein n=1 Tax=Streptomyces nigrescens TaxID=1920 RepID=UPI0036FDE097
MLERLGRVTVAQPGDVFLPGSDGAVPALQHPTHRAQQIFRTTVGNLVGKVVELLRDRVDQSLAVIEEHRELGPDFGVALLGPYSVCFVI